MGGFQVQDSPEETEVKANAIGHGLDRIQSLRNKLVTILEGNFGEAEKAKAREAIANLPKFDSAEQGGMWQERRTKGVGDQPGLGPRGMLSSVPNATDPNPQRPQFAGFPTLQEPGGWRSEDPNILQRVDSSIGHMAVDPAKRRQALVEYDKGFTGGALGRAIQKTEGALGPLVKKIPLVGEHIDTESVQPERMRQYAQEAPLGPAEQVALRTAGALNPRSLFNMFGRAAAGGVRAVAPAAAERAPGLFGLLSGTAHAAAGAGGTAATEDVVEEGTFKHPLDTAANAAAAGYDAATNPVTLGIGALFGGVGGKLESFRSRNPAYRRIAEAGGEVGPTTSGRGEPFDDPLVAQGIDETGTVTERGIGRTSRAAARGSHHALEDRANTIKGEYRRDLAELEGRGGAAEEADATATMRHFREMLDDPEIETATKNYIRREILDPEGGYGQHVRITNGPDGQQRISMRADMLNSMRRKLAKAADFVHPTKTDPDLEGAAGAAQGDVAQTEFGPLNARYHADLERVEHARRGLTLPEPTGKPLTRQQEEAVGNFFHRFGRDTHYAGRGETPELEQALQEFPELRRFVRAPQLLQDKSDLSFKAPGEDATGGLYKKYKGMVEKNLTPAAVRIAGPIGGAIEGAAPTAPVLSDFLRDIAATARAEHERRKKQRAP